MKATNLIKLTALFIAVVSLSLTGCKKNQNGANADPSSLQQLAADQNQYQNASDEAMNDVNNLLSQGSLKSTDQLPCNATIDSTTIQNDSITLHITYNGLSCNGKKFRTGQVDIKHRVGMHWGEQGAAVIVTFINFKVTKVANNKTITLNGTRTHQNVSGGHLWMLGNTRTSIVYKTWGSMSILFDDNTTRNWNVARQQTYTGVLTNLILTVDGFGQSGTYTGLVVWGVNRQGENFYSQIQQSVVYKQTCDWDPVSGIQLHSIPGDNKSALVTFGYNSNNQPIGTGECPTKYKVDWTKNNQSGTVYLWL